MKKFNAVYFFLFILLVMGAFASMAQNEYGMTILGLVSGAFSLLFGIQLVDSLKNDAYTRIDLAELSSLTVLSALLALRVFQIYFKWAEFIFMFAAVILLLVYVSRIISKVVSYQKAKTPLIWLVVLFYLSLMVYIISMVAVPFWPVISEPAGIIAFILLIIFSISSWRFKKISANGENFSAFQLVARLKDRSILLISLFLIFTLYAGFTRIGWLPKMYTSELPQSYYELLKDAETGKEKPLNGKYQYEEFKVRYDDFVKKHSGGRN
ncbi:MAG: hypothetical protein IPP04_00845 [Saprospiraceae bacterium]|nr:hypothetical protein [Saprospiraceae bacterium]